MMMMKILMMISMSHLAGPDEIAADAYSLFQRGHHHVLQVPSLRSVGRRGKKLYDANTDNFGSIFSARLLRSSAHTSALLPTGHHNNEIQSAGQVHARGSTYTVKCTTHSDMDRQLVKSEFATLTVPEFELTLPPGKGQLTNIESIINATIEDLDFDQPVRAHTDKATHDKIDALIKKLRTVVPPKDDAHLIDPDSELERTITVKLDDPTGNSFIEAKGGLSDPKWSKREYRRTQAQNEAVGASKAHGGDGSVPDDEEYPDAHHEVSREAALAAATAALHARGTKTAGSSDDKQKPAQATGKAQPTPATLTDDYVAENPDEVFSFPDICSSCGSLLETYMKPVSIPHFKEVVLMSTNCHSCGYRDNEIKSGGAVSELGRKITLKVEDLDDLSRDVLKSETAALTIPEIDLHLQPGTLGGRFTTLEGLLGQVYEELDEKVFARGDAAKGQDKSEMGQFLVKLKSAMEVTIQYTIILDDPLANSYIQNPYAPDEDPNMETVEYTRDFDQNEDLGLNDVQVEGYHGEEEARLAREEDDRKTAAAAETATS